MKIHLYETQGCFGVLKMTPCLRGTNRILRDISKGPQVQIQQLRFGSSKKQPAVSGALSVASPGENSPQRHHREIQEICGKEVCMSCFFLPSSNGGFFFFGGVAN